MVGMGSAIMIEQLSRALAQHCPHCPANERQPTACLLAAFLQGDYPWFTAARERDDARFMVYCRARRRHHASDVLSDAASTALAEASERFLRAIRDHALPRLDHLHHYANTDDTGGVAFRGVTFATATAKMKFVEALPEVTGQQCESFTEQIETALDFARVGEAVEPTMNPLQLQLAKFGYATLPQDRVGYWSVQVVSISSACIAGMAFPRMKEKSGCVVLSHRFAFDQVTQSKSTSSWRQMHP